MKKIILSLCILGLLTGTAMAACNGGKMRSGFCVSRIPMNWWSAAAWCQANGMSLASVYDVCPDWDGNTGENKCGQIIDSSWNSLAWTSTASAKNSAYFVGLSNGNVNSWVRHYNSYDLYYIYALCK